jgi:hypothetical protein
MPLPSCRKAVGYKWVFKVKKHQDDTLDKFKARLVAKGFTQREGIDYDEVFAPVVGIFGLRILLSLAAKEEMQIPTFDVSSSYLYSKLDKEVYLKIPEGYEGTYNPGDVLPLLKGLYGLKQSGKLWNEEL